MGIHTEEGAKKVRKLFSASSDKRRTDSSILHDRRFIISENTAFSITEEYKTLRTNIMFSIPSNECRVIGITSAEPMEGKSINCLNTAITFAQTDARVLLVDCDLRLPRISSLVAMDAIPGISNILVGMNTIEESVHKTKFSGLDVLLSGDIPPNPSELLGSDNMGIIIKKLSQNYDYIFVDLPPINVVADVAAMSKYLSGVILVVRSQVSNRESVAKAISKLELTGANVIGIVLNGVKNKTLLGNKAKYYSYNKYGY
jgi:capsular exopolysaccharide synthesis family protein